MQNNARSTLSKRDRLIIGRNFFVNNALRSPRGTLFANSASPVGNTELGLANPERRITRMAQVAFGDPDQSAIDGQRGAFVERMLNSLVSHVCHP